MLKRGDALVLFMGFVAAIGGGYAIGEPAPSEVQAARAREAWQAEFDDICSRSQNAMTFSQQELADLIQRCDVLMTQIEKLDGTRKKLCMGRLRKCRGLYAYVLESKRNEKK
jgi:hypothetical protein